MNDAALKAVLSYYKDSYKPSGKTDKGGRWYPDELESCSCCTSVRSPSRSWPWSLWKHCNTLKHIKNRILEKPYADETEALGMILEDAPLHINDEKTLMFHVAKKLLGR